MNFFLKQYEIDSSRINVRGELGLCPLLGLLQDSASLHAEQIGLGRADMKSSGLFWVLTRQRVRMHRWPRWKESVQIETWIRPGNKAISQRDFRILSGSGDEIGLCATNWVALDLSSRRPVAWDRSTVLGGLENRGQVELEAERILAEAGGELLAHRRVCNSDLDHNLHVNNTKYAQWILDALTFNEFRNLAIHEYAVNFLEEARISELIRIEALEKPKGLLQYQGMKEENQRAAFTVQFTFLA